MWSGPRNISTAMLRAWGNRPDTFVCDEPLYAHYLAVTGAPHPGREEVIAAGERDWRRVAEWLTGPVPEGRRIFYQKHMAHHLLPEIGRDWLRGLRHCFLIRHPREMLPSLARVLERPELPDTAFPQQLEFYEWLLRETGVPPPVVDAADVLRDPAGQLRLLCEALDVPFTDAMLAWPPGPRATDGVWARHWYGNVEQSTGFQPYCPKTEPLAPELEPLLAASLPLYESLYARRLGA